MNQPVISKVYHNRCVLLDADQMAQAGITKNSQVSVSVNGDTIMIRKAIVLDSGQQEQALMDCLVSFIRTMTPEQIGMVKNAVCLQPEV